MIAKKILKISGIVAAWFLVISCIPIFASALWRWLCFVGYPPTVQGWADFTQFIVTAMVVAAVTLGALAGSVYIATRPAA